MTKNNGEVSVKEMAQEYGRKCREVELLSEKLDYPHKEIADMQKQIATLTAELERVKGELAEARLAACKYASRAGEAEQGEAKLEKQLAEATDRLSRQDNGSVHDFLKWKEAEKREAKLREALKEIKGEADSPTKSLNSAVCILNIIVEKARAALEE